MLVSGSQQDELDAQLKKLNQKGMKSRVQELMLQDDVLFAKTKASLYGDQGKQGQKQKQSNSSGIAYGNRYSTQWGLKNYSHIL